MPVTHKYDHQPKKFKPTAQAVIKDPLFNKDTAFTMEEREQFGLRGLLPPKIESIELQLIRAKRQFDAFKTPLEKYIYLSSLQERNETLFFNLLTNNLVETMPIVYTPTVGEACQKFDRLWRGARGMYLSIATDKGEVDSILNNWNVEPDIIVVTDGSRILGLGDLGANGMGIPIGKLSLYVAGAGFHPLRTLPITLDVGTNNEKLLKDELYLGNSFKRIRGKEFYEFVDEFLLAVKSRWPKCLVQFEDFSNDVCFELLERYRNKILCFNDDIQGTGAVVVGGYINAVKMSGKDFSEQKIVFAGAGSAAVGVANQILTQLINFGIPKEEAVKRFYLIDSKGLVTVHRGDKLAVHKLQYAREDIQEDLKTIQEVVDYIKPTTLIGLSGVGGQFTDDVIKSMAKYNERPIIFALSNPTKNSECSAEQAYKNTDGKCIFASGSPFPVYEHKGQLLTPGQGNNMYIFPGLGLGAVVAQAKSVSEQMVLSAAETLSNCTTKEELSAGKIYPDLKNIRSISFEIAKAVAKQAVKEGLSSRDANTDWDKVIKQFTYDPQYVELKK